MPTALPRIALSVRPEFDATVSRLAHLSGQSKARVLLDILEPAEPFLAEVANLLETADTLRQEPVHQITANLAALRERVANRPNLPPRVHQLLAELARELDGSDTDPDAPLPPVL